MVWTKEWGPKNERHFGGDLTQSALRQVTAFRGRQWAKNSGQKPELCTNHDWEAKHRPNRIQRAALTKPEASLERKVAKSGALAAFRKGLSFELEPDEKLFEGFTSPPKGFTLESLHARMTVKHPSIREELSVHIVEEKGEPRIA